MNKSELVAAIAERTGSTKVAAEESLKATIDVISDQLHRGDTITLIGFVTFSVTNRKARTGRNPQTGAAIKIAAKKVVKFKPGKAIGELVDTGKKKKPAAGKKRC
jgi:DNA-binding protein HU-beta